MRRPILARMLLVAVLATFFLPASWKTTPRWRHLQNPRLHVLAGIIDLLIVAVLHAWRIDGYLEAIQRTNAELQQSPTLQQEPGETRVAVMMGTPVIMVFAYMFRPLSLLLTACGLFGVVRALDAGFNQGCRGSLPVEVLFWVASRLGLAAHQASEERALGEVQPDVVIGPEQSPSGLLELRCNRLKPFSDVQVVRYQEALYRIEGRDDVLEDGHKTFRYRFRPLEGWENIAGEVIELSGEPLPGPRK